MEPKPIAGIVKDCKVICEPKELKEYGEGTKVMLVSEKLFSNIIRGLGEIEEDLNLLKELKISLKVERMEQITRDLETKFKALSYREYLGEEKDLYLE
jgi:hypothetical protein